MLLCCLAACASPDGGVNHAPIANAGRDLRVVRPSEVVFVELDGLGSHDPDGDTITWKWSVVSSPEDGEVIPAALRATPRPVVPLASEGLYVFSLQVRDDEARSTPDFVNVWVTLEPPSRGGPDGGVAPDGGAGGGGEDPDGSDAAGEAPDGGAEDPDGEDPDDPDAPGGDADADAGDPDEGAPPPDAAPPPPPPDAGPPPPDAAAGPNVAPTPVIDVSATRVDVGQVIRFSAARSRDDGRRAPLTFGWRAVTVPFGSTPSFRTDAPAFDFTPRWPGRYTFELTAHDGELSASTRVSVHARGPLAWLLYPEQGEAQAIGTADGAPVRPRVELGSLEGLTGFVARAGVLYAGVVQGGDSILVIAAPGRPVVRRVLAEDTRMAGPAAGRGGVWVPLRGTPELVFSDPVGASPLTTLRLPARYHSGFWMVADGGRAWMSHPTDPTAVAEIDIDEGRLRRDLLRGGEACALMHTLAIDDDYVYIGCRQRNGVARVRRGHAGDVRAQDVIDLPGGPVARNKRVVLADDHIVVRHDATDYVSVVPTARWLLTPDHADRRPGAQRVVRVADAVVDIAARGPTFYTLVNDAEGAVQVDAFEASTGSRLWSRRQPGRRATYLAIDAADEFSRDLGDL